MMTRWMKFLSRIWLSLAIRNYIENKHEEGLNPSLRYVSSIKACRDADLRCKDIALLVHDMGYSIERNEDKVLSELEVRPEIVES